MRSNIGTARLAAGLAAVLVCGHVFAQPPELLLTPPRAASAQVVAEDFLRQSAGRLGLVETDLEYRRLESSYLTRHNRVSHEFFQQYVDGVPVYKGIFQVNVLADGRVLNSTSGFEANVRARASALQPALTVQQALVAAANHFGIQNYVVPTPEAAPAGRQQKARFAGGALSESPIDAELVFEPVNGELRLAWRLVVDRYSAHQQHLDMRFDALTGELLAQDDWVNFFSPGDTSPQGAVVPYNAEYRASPFPAESPGHPGGAPVLVQNPWEMNASPSGWQDTRTDPPTGQPESLYTRGNNVRAQLDLSANNNDLDSNRALGVWDSGSDTLRFDFPWIESEEADSAANRLASVVNLFYWNNIIHDVLWQYGFDEPAGNFQQNNFGRGGSGSDAVRADALDGSGTNNANFSTPGDGSPGRMQMFRWTSPGGIEIDSPFEATYVVDVPGDWGGAFVEVENDIVPVNSPGAGTVGDGTGVEGCAGTYTNAAAVAGKVALVRRGGCEFGMKALVAQQNGAAAVVIFNSATGAPGGMGGGTSGSAVTIPVMGLMDYETGTQLVAAAATQTVHGTLKAKLYPDRDSDFDAGIMAHEYGHGVSNRLTGGTQTGCLSGGEQAGEGWSDFYALHFTMTDAVCSVPRGVGTYPGFEPVDGLGIRQYRYTRDMQVNPHDFADVALARLDTNGNVIPHDVGEVWNTMLWDLSCNLMQKHGFEPDIYSRGGGNGLAIQLVTDGLKLQGCRPTFVAARNGILAADAAIAVADPAYESEKCLIWKTFARRGLGLNANSGTVNSHTDQTQDFTVPPECAADPQVKVVVTGPGTVTPGSLFVGAQFSESLELTLVPDAGASIQSAEGCGGELDGDVFSTDLVVDACTVRIQFTSPDYLFGDGAE